MGAVDSRKEQKMLRFKDIKLRTQESYESYSIEKVNDNDIAIIGMAGYFPEADTLEKFWDNLRLSKDHIRDLPEGRKRDLDPYVAEKLENLRYIQAGFLDRVDSFDYSFFGFSPSEANAMDPNQRIFLEVAWKAIEDAGYGGAKMTGSETGVYVGFSGNAGGLYQQYVGDVDPQAQSVPGGLNALIASRISYLLDLRGPSALIDTSCSSSLVAIHMASRALRNGDCSMALCGGVNINLLPLENNYKVGIESSTYRAKAFAEDADGTVSGEGSAVVMLKPLHAAMQDQDHIYAVIKGSAINQDGKSNGITSPNKLAQERVLLKAWKDANISPESLSYIEAHGTGTKIGDPIEVEALSSAIRKYTNRTQFCAISSLKSSIGHLDGAAGIASLVKAVLSLKHRVLLPSLHFNCPNRLINFIESPVYVNREATAWEQLDGKRRCGVNAFGMSGTNCHVVLEEYVEDVNGIDASNEHSWYPVTFSAKDDEALLELMSSYIHHIQHLKQTDLERLSYTVNTGRESYSFKILILVQNIKDLLDKLKLLIESVQQWHLMEDQWIYYADGREREYVLPFMDGLKETVRMNGIRYLMDVAVKWEEVYPIPVHKIALPTYPFKKTRCWVEFKPTFETARLIGTENLSKTEQIVGHIWMNVLGYNELDLNTNFFELGGDSIMALKIINQLKETLSIDVAISVLLTNQSIASFSQAIDQHVEATMIPIVQSTENKEQYPLSFAQRGIYMAHQRTDVQTSYNMPGALDIYGVIDEMKMETALSKLVDLHRALNSSFQMGDTMPFQRYSPRKLDIQWVRAEESQLESLYTQFVRPFHLADDLLIRVCIVRCAANNHCIFFDVHHLVADGVSMNILIEDFVRLYTGQDVMQPKYEYKDYTVWQNSPAAAPFYQKQEAFWLEHLKGKLPILNMPSDFPRPQKKGFTGDEVRVEVDPLISKRLRALANQEGITLHTLLLSVYAVLLFRHSGQEDIIIGNPVSGRYLKEWERVVGMFVNTLAIRLKPEIHLSFRTFLTSVRDVMYQALDNQDFPFEWIASRVDTNRSADRSPLFDTMFIMQNNKTDSITIDELQFTPRVFSNTSSKFDFKLEVYELPSSLSIVMDYRTDLYRKETVQTWIQHYLYLLEHLDSHLDMSLQSLALADRSISKMKNFNDVLE